MVVIEGINPIVMWGGFILLIIVLLLIDLLIFNKKKHEPSMKEALIWTAVWISFAMLFNLFIWYKGGHQAGLEFFTGYLIEKSLSLDNLFVMLIIFSTFNIEPKYQHKVLFWGILSAIILRGIFIIAGTTIIAKFHWILYLFAIFLVYTGFMLFFKKMDDKFDPNESFIVKIVRKIIPVSTNQEEGKFFTKENGKHAVTVLFVALIVIEFSDIIFAFDSIPAIFGITLDPYIVFTSNMFAILGLRSLYFVLHKAHKYFGFLSMALATILTFIGLKMLLAKYVEVPIFLSLGIIIGVLAINMIASVVMTKIKNNRPKHKKVIQL
jgi:tellurite resistance protein TerC